MIIKIINKSFIKKVKIKKKWGLVWGDVNRQINYLMFVLLI
jgi:hypothetical protein